MIMMSVALKQYNLEYASVPSFIIRVSFFESTGLIKTNY